MTRLDLNLTNVEICLLSAEPPLISVLCLNEKDPLFQQAAVDARALFPSISKYSDIQEFDGSYGAVLEGRTAASPPVQEVARQLQRLDDANWNFYHFVVSSIEGSRAVGIGSNAKKRERAAYTALAVTKLLSGGNGPVSSEMQQLASSIRRQMPRPGEKPVVPPRAAEVPARGAAGAATEHVEPMEPTRQPQASALDDDLPPWLEVKEPATNSSATGGSAGPYQAAPAVAAVPKPKKANKANKIGRIVEEAVVEAEVTEAVEEDEDGDEVVFSQPLVTEPPWARAAELAGPEPHVADALRQATWRAEDAQTIRTTGTDDIPLGTDTDPSNYTNLWLAGRSSNTYTQLAYTHDLDSRVLDAENIGFTYGGRVLGIRGFAIEGVEKAVEYFRLRGIKALVIGQREVLQKLRVPGAVEVIVADKIDDTIVLKKGFEKKCPIVSRDEFRKEQEDLRLDAAVRRWYKEEGSQLQVKYTFDEKGAFLPSYDLSRPIVMYTKEQQDGYAA